VSTAVRTGEEVLLALAKSRLLALERALPLLIEEYSGEPDARATLLALKSAVQAALAALAHVEVPKTVRMPQVRGETALYDAALLAEDAAEYLSSAGRHRLAKRLAELSARLEALAEELAAREGEAPLFSK
jgi:hypothetical protein